MLLIGTLLRYSLSITEEIVSGQSQNGICDQNPGQQIYTKTEWIATTSQQENTICDRNASGSYCQLHTELGLPGN